MSNGFGPLEAGRILGMVESITPSDLSAIIKDERIARPYRFILSKLLALRLAMEVEGDEGRSGECILHHLWGRAIDSVDRGGIRNYQKREWVALQNYIERLEDACGAVAAMSADLIPETLKEKCREALR